MENLTSDHYYAGSMSDEFPATNLKTIVKEVRFFLFAVVVGC